jgi:hypothetical protein
LYFASPAADHYGMDGKSERSSEKTPSPAHPQPGDPKHGEWLIDEASEESFPASDPSSVAQPHRKSPDPRP